jgi:hypothetical protein
MAIAAVVVIARRMTVSTVMVARAFAVVLVRVAVVRSTSPVIASAFVAIARAVRTAAVLVDRDRLGDRAVGAAHSERRGCEREYEYRDRRDSVGSRELRSWPQSNNGHV